MKITILTLFPDMFTGFLNNSIIKRAIAKKTCEIEIVNFRDFTNDKYGRVDTPPVGGGAGLILKAQPLVDAIESRKEANSKVILFSPRGKTFSQGIAKELKEEKHIILICGHYEGVDERVNAYVDDCISIGDFILTGGELPSMVVSDAIIRLLDGTINQDSLIKESFDEYLLEYPQYTEPFDFRGEKVPQILYSGNHKAIEKWRRKKSLKNTQEHRPDLFSKVQLTKADLKLLNEDDDPKWERQAIEKGKKFIKD